MATVDFSEFRDRATEILDGVTDLTLLVLKGHLLLEEVLYEMIRAKCAHPQYIEKAQLRFPQLIHVARALYEANDDNKQPIFWGAMEALNTLRNRLAHKLEPKDLAPLLKRLDIRAPEEPTSLSDPKLLDSLGNSIAMFLGFARGWLDLEERRSPIGAGARPRRGR